MRWGLRYQLLVPLVTLLLGVAGITTWTAMSSAERARLQLETRMRHVAETLNVPPLSSAEISRPILNQMKRLSGADFLLLRQDGSRPPHTLSSEPDRLPPPTENYEDLETLRLRDRVLVEGRPYLCSGIRLRPPREKNILYILFPEALWRDVLWEAVWPSLILGGFFGLASVGLAVEVGRRLTRRIQELERRTRQIAAGDFSPMPLPRRDDELRDLARSVNDMAGRLAQLQETVQRTERLRLLGQVSGGLAHQLRNGVTGARLAVQLLMREWEDWKAGKGPPPDPAALDVALRQLTLVETNLKRFLDLGRASPGPPQPCSLTALVTEVVGLLQPQCRHAGIELRWTVPDDSRTIHGDPGQLQQLLHNVVGNAIEAAGPGGRVEVHCESGKTPAHRVIEVIDSGSGPPPELAGRLFEPFVTGKPEGVGLGLAVARQVAEGHGGGVSWSRRDGWTCFRIELSDLPATPADRDKLEEEAGRGDFTPRPAGPSSGP